MMAHDTTGTDVTVLLQAWSRGDDEALERLTPLVFDDLRRIARRHFASERAAHTLQPTALVSELFLRLLGRRSVAWANRRQFFQGAIEIMRHILVDSARKRATAKRGGDVGKVPLDDVAVPIGPPGIDHLELDQAIQRLDPVARYIVQLRFYFGLTHKECGEVLHLSEEAVKKRWLKARLDLHRWLNDRSPEGDH